MSTTPDIYNLDAEQEFFTFTLGGHVYKFRHLTSDELEKLTSYKNDDKGAREYLSGFISSDDTDAPSFTEASQKFILPQWKKFFTMLGAEWSAQ